MEPDAANQSSADKYLHETPVEKWGIVDYLESNPTLPFGGLCRSWVKALSSLSDSSVQMDEKKKAASLLKNYKEGNDGHLAREWRDQPKISPGSLVIQNSFNHSKIQLTSLPGFVTSSSDSARPPQKRTNKKKRKRCSDAQVDAHRTSFIGRFSECYKAMNNDRKWQIPSGVFLEDVLYERFKNEQVELAVHSWIVDTCDPRVESCFSTDDWEAICDQVPPLPEADPLLVQSMRRFMSLQTPAELRNAVYKTSFLGKDESFDMEKHQGPGWVDFVMRSLLPFYDNPSMFDDQGNSENWYIVYVWSTIFDRCMLTIDGSLVSRGESVSISASNRKNPRPLDPTKRKRIGHLYDGVLKIDGGEAGAMEHAKKFTGDTSRKWVSDSLKVAKVLHDMLYHLEPRVNHSLPILKQLPMVGLVTGGLHCQLLRMNYAQGHICLLSADEPRVVPTQVKDYEPLFALLVSFWKFRTLMHGFKAAVACKSETQEILVEQLMKTSAVPKPVRILPRSVETDGEADVE